MHNVKMVLPLWIHEGFGEAEEVKEIKDVKEVC
jgi:hypothetical protein